MPDPRFNEAFEAIKPRNLKSGIRWEEARFNEAEAIKPRNPAIGSGPCHLRLSMVLQ